jgi:TniQ
MISKLLPVRPRPRATESGFGYMVRLMEKNGFPLSSRARGLLRVGSDFTAWGLRFPIVRFYKLLGAHREELERISYVDGPSTKTGGRGIKTRENFKILGHSLGSTCGDVHRAESPALCPECVKENGFIDALFDLRAVIACPTHRTYVVRTCPKCQHPMKWTRRGLLKCRCGGSFAETEGVRAPLDLIQLMSVIKAKLHGEPLEEAALQAQFPKDLLEKMSLVSMIRFVSLLGKMNLEIGGKDAATDEEILRSAGAVLRNWPVGFYEFLERIGRRPAEAKERSHYIREQFSVFLEPTLRLLKRDPARELLRAEFYRFARQNWSFFHDRRGRHGEGKRYVSIDAFAKMIGEGIATARRLVDEGLVSAKVYEVRGKRMTLIDTYNSSGLPPGYGTIRLKQVSRELGIPEPVLQMLRERGVYETKPRKALSGRAQSFWFREDVREFEDRLIRSRITGEVSTRPAISFATVMGRNYISRAAKFEVVSAVLDGRLNVLSCSGTLDGLVLDREQVEKLCQVSHADVSVQSYSIREAERRLGLENNAMREAISAGVLPAVDTKMGQRIPVEALERFNRDMLILGRLAHQLGVGQNKLETVCSELGVPLTRLSKGGARGGCQILIPCAREPDVVAVIRGRRREAAAAPEGKADRERRCIAALVKYYGDLRAAGGYLPRRNGFVSLRQVTKACGFSYNAWMNYPGLKARLLEFDAEDRSVRGLEGAGPLAMLRRYLRGLAQRDEPLPIRSKGTPGPNEVRIARAAGFNARAFRQDPQMRALVREYLSARNIRHPAISQTTWEACHSTA